MLFLCQNVHTFYINKTAHIRMVASKNTIVFVLYDITSSVALYNEGRIVITPFFNQIMHLGNALLYDVVMNRPIFWFAHTLAVLCSISFVHWSWEIYGYEFLKWCINVLHLFLRVIMINSLKVATIVFPKIKNWKRNGLLLFIARMMFQLNNLEVVFIDDLWVSNFNFFHCQKKKGNQRMTLIGVLYLKYIFDYYIW